MSKSKSKLGPELPGVPKKNAPMFQTAITPTKMAQKSKVR